MVDKKKKLLLLGQLLYTKDDYLLAMMEKMTFIKFQGANLLKEKV